VYFDKVNWVVVFESIRDQYVSKTWQLVKNEQKTNRSAKLSGVGLNLAGVEITL
jgi:hypothetical protein